jgi:hypothetical protein
MFDEELKIGDLIEDLMCITHKLSIIVDINKQRDIYKIYNFRFMKMFERKNPDDLIKLDDK